MAIQPGQSVSSATPDLFDLFRLKDRSLSKVKGSTALMRMVGSMGNLFELYAEQFANGTPIDLQKAQDNLNLAINSMSEFAKAYSDECRTMLECLDKVGFAMERERAMLDDFDVKWLEFSSTKIDEFFEFVMLEMTGAKSEKEIIRVMLPKYIELVKGLNQVFGDLSGVRNDIIIFMTQTLTAISKFAQPVETNTLWQLFNRPL